MGEFIDLLKLLLQIYMEFTECAYLRHRTGQRLRKFDMNKKCQCL